MGRCDVTPLNSCEKESTFVFDTERRRFVCHVSGLGCGFSSLYFRSETVCFQVPGKGREQGIRPTFCTYAVLIFLGGTIDILDLLEFLSWGI